MKGTMRSEQGQAVTGSKDGECWRCGGEGMDVARYVGDIGGEEVSKKVGVGV